MLKNNNMMANTQMILTYYAKLCSNSCDTDNSILYMQDCSQFLSLLNKEINTELTHTFISKDHADPAV